MLEINLYNYEEYVVDFLEDNLESSERDAFLLFLEANPEIKEELELFDNEKLIPEPIVFDHKDILKKESIITTSALSNFDEICVARMEGDLSEKEISLFDELIHSDKLKKTEFESFKKTRLKPDNTIVFKGKDRLKKKPIGIWKKSYSLVSIAASIVIIIGLFTLLPQANSDADLLPSIAEVTENTKEPQIANKELVAVSQDKHEKIEKVKTLPINKIDTEEKLAELEIEVVENLGLDKIDEKEYFEKLEAKLTFIESDFSNNVMLKDMLIYEKEDYKLKRSDYLSVRSYVAKTFNRNVLHRDKVKIEVFDIAQAGVEGLNRLTGGNMKLERVYDDNGKLDKTEFTSKLLAFSTPSKK
jgi:hypothetical protein